MTEKILGVLLAGGLGTRMGAGDKPLKMIAGKSILARVIARMAPQCAQLVINANGDPRRFAEFDLPVIADTFPENAGPLAGVLAAMEHCAIAHPGIDSILSVATDGPFMPRDLAARLAKARREAGADIAVAASGGWNHPTIALWAVTLREPLRAGLEGGLRKIDRWTANYRVATVEWVIDGFDPFFNANTPDDLAGAEKILVLHPLA